MNDKITRNSIDNDEVVSEIVGTATTLLDSAIDTVRNLTDALNELEGVDCGINFHLHVEVLRNVDEGTMSKRVVITNNQSGVLPLITGIDMLADTMQRIQSKEEKKGKRNGATSREVGDNMCHSLIKELKANGTTPEDIISLATNLTEAGEIIDQSVKQASVMQLKEMLNCGDDLPDELVQVLKAHANNETLH